MLPPARVKSPRIRLPMWLLAAAPAMAQGIDPVSIMPIGDSITRGSWTPYSVRNDVPGGYRRTLHQQLTGHGLDIDFVGEKSDNAASGMDPHHNGNDGWRTDQMLASLSGWLAADPDVVLIKAGTNDILQQKPVPTVLRNLENLIHEVLMHRPGRKAFVATVIPVTSNWGGIPKETHTANVLEYNAGVRNIVARLADQSHDVVLVDLHDQVVLTDPDPAKTFFQPGDGVHPGQAGYDQLGTLWFSAIAAQTPLPTAPPAGIPAKPTGLAATVRSASAVDLSWNDPATDETTQEIWCLETTAGVWTKIATVPADVTTFTAVGLRTGDRAYRFAVNGRNANGPSGWSNQAAANASGAQANLAHGKPATASSFYSAGHAPAMANDGATGSIWASTGNNPHWWQVDLQQEHLIGRLELVTRQDASDVAEQRRNFEILASVDPTFASYTVLGSRGNTAAGHKETLSFQPAAPAACRYIRIRKTVVESFSIAELRAFGSLPADPPAVPAGTTAVMDGTGGILLTWLPSAGDASGYRVERRTGNGPYLTVHTIDGDATEFIDSAIEDGVAYLYRVFSVNAAGSSDAGTEASIATPTAYGTWADGLVGFSALQPEEKSPSADPNGDGIENLLAYAFGIDPLGSDGFTRLPSLTPSEHTEDDGFHLRFHRNRAAADLDYVLERTASLAPLDWAALPFDGATAVTEDGNPLFERVSVPITPEPGMPAALFRVRVVRTGTTGVD